MSITNHVAILANSALVTPIPNKLKIGNPLEYFALLAFAPEAEADLRGVVVEKAVATFGKMGPDVSVSIETNARRKTPLPGIPDNWIVVRGVSRFAPELYDSEATQIVVTAENAGQLKTLFYAGRRVRVTLSAWAWTHQSGGKGVAFNIDGVMDAGEGARLALGNPSANTFSQFAGAKGNGQQASAAPSAPSASNPFAQSANPFK